MTTTVNLKNLRPGDAITVLDYTAEKKSGGKYNFIPLHAGRPVVVKAVSLPFVYTDDIIWNIINTREYQIMRISKKALA